MDWVLYKKIAGLNVVSSSFFVVLFVFTTFYGVTYASEVSSSVTVSKDRVRFVREPKNVLVAPSGDTVELPCAAVNDNNNGLQIVWTFNGEPTRSYPVAKNGSLIIRNVSLSHEGAYRCVVLVLFPTYGVVFSTSANITIARIRNFSIEPQDFIAPPGGVARFQCAADATPSASYVWYHNDLPLKTDDTRLKILSSGILQILNVVQSDVGIYYCVASNAFGNLTSRSASLTVTSNNKPSDLSLTVLKAPRNVSAVKGNTALFECLFSSIPAPEVYWKKIDGVLPSSARQIGSNLKLRSVEPLFDGAYECVGKWKDKEIHLTANLSVDVSPQIREFPQEIIKRRGETARFSCNTASKPVPEIVWYKNGEVIVPQGRIKMFPTVSLPPERLVKPSGEIEFKRDLLISSVRLDDTGVYQCFASNYLGEVGAAAALVYNSDDVTYDPPENFQAVVNQTNKNVQLSWEIPQSLDEKKIAVFIVHFHSNGNGDVENTDAVEPKTACSNRKCRTACCLDTTPLKSYTNYTFWVSGLLDSGIFTLPSNETIVTTWDEVSTAPAPLLVQETSVPGAVRLIWDNLEANLRRGEVVEYRVEYKEPDSPTVSAIVVGPGVNEKLLSGLKLNVFYFFRVIPKTRAGYPTNLMLNTNFYWVKFKIRDVSSLASSVTAAEAPWLTTKVLNSTAIFVEFRSEMNISDDFRIVLTKINNDKDQTIIINVTSPKKPTVIGTLQPFSLYQIYVSLDGGLLSSRVVRTAKLEGNEPRAPPLPLIPYPKNIACSLEAPRRVRVHWAQPPPYTAVKYTIRYSLSTDGDELLNVSSIKYKETKIDSIMLDDLAPGRSYLIAVKTETNMGNSKFSDDVTCTVPTTVPASPKGLTSTVLNNSSVLITWSPGAWNDDVLYYRVRYKLNNAFENDWQEIITNGTRRAVLNDLIPTEIYFVTVSAENNAGTSPYSQTLPVVIPTTTSTTTRVVIVERTSYTEGIVIGICIAVVCVFVVLVFRAKRQRGGWSWRICGTWAGGGQDRSNLNGAIKTAPNGHLPNGHCARDYEKVEMLTLLPPLMENCSSDSKGGNESAGSRYVNGFSQRVAENGFHKPLLAQTDPLTVTVESPTTAAADQSSDLSQSAATGSSMQSWSNNGKNSNCCTKNGKNCSSMPNLTDSGIGFDEVTCNGGTVIPYPTRAQVHNNLYHYQHRPEIMDEGKKSTTPPPLNGLINNFYPVQYPVNKFDNRTTDNNHFCLDPATNLLIPTKNLTFGTTSC